jgi:hypothetical protein
MAPRPRDTGFAEPASSPSSQDFGSPGRGAGERPERSYAPDRQWDQEQDQERADRKATERTARAAGMAPLSHRPWTLTLLAVLVVLGVGALAGWQTQWPGAIFGVQKTAAFKPAPTGQASSQVQASTPDSVTPSGGTAVVPQVPASGSASGNPSDPASVVSAYFAAINSGDYATAWTLGGRNTGATYSEFISGFATTNNDTVTVLSTLGDVVTAQLVAQQDDGSTKTFEGTYTVSGGVITSFDVKQTG